MELTPDMKDLLDIFKRLKVKWLLTGGFAVNYYGYTRSTLDIDILILPTKENARKVIKALEEFGFGPGGVPEDLFNNEGTAFHIGIEPNRIDILTSLKGVPNESIFSEAKRIRHENIYLNLISLKHLLKIKKTSKRLKDQADFEELTRILKHTDRKL